MFISVHMLINFVQMKLCFEWKKKTRFVENLQPNKQYNWFGKTEGKRANIFDNDINFLFHTCYIFILCIFVQGSRRMPASLSISMAPLSDTRTTWVTLTTTTSWARWMNTGWVAGWMWVSSSIFKGVVSEDPKKVQSFLLPNEKF